MRHKNAITTFLVLSFFCISSLAALAKSFTVKGVFKNAEPGQYIYLFRHLGPDIEKMDSTKHKAGAFTFTLKDDFPRGFYRIGISEAVSAMLILGAEDISLTGDLKSLPASLVIKDSKENTIYKSFMTFNEGSHRFMQSLDLSAQKLLPEKAVNPDKYNTEIGKLQMKLDSSNRNQTKFYSQLVTQNNGLFASKMIQLFLISDSVRKDNFFSPAELTDDEYTRGDMLSSKISIYFQKFSQPNIDSYKATTTEILNLAPAGSRHKEVFYLTLSKLFLPFDGEYAKSIASAYKNEFPKSAAAKRLWSSMPKGTPVVGDDASEIKLTDPTGKVIALSSLRGKVVLLDFWASWCGPCRKENPNVVEAYEKFKDKGFTVFSVSLDSEKENWMQAIKKDNLTWSNHVSDLKGWQSSAAALYNVKGIPATFLLDQKGKIVATNLRGQSLEEKLETLCK